MALEFVEHREKRKSGVSKTQSPQVAEHRLHGGGVLGTGAMQSDRVRRIDVTQMAHIFHRRPNVGSRSAAESDVRGRRDGAAYLRWQRNDGRKRVRDVHGGEIEFARIAYVVFRRKRRQ